MVDGNKLNFVLEFIYIRSIISSNGCIVDEIQKRMAKARASFGRLRQRLWNNHHVSMRIKGKIYRAIVLSTSLYRAEAWTVYRRQGKKLHATSAFDLEDNLDGQSDKQGNTRTDRAAICGRSSDQKESPVNLMKTSPDRLPKQVLYSQLSSGDRKRGRLRHRFKDTIKET